MKSTGGNEWPKKVIYVSGRFDLLVTLISRLYMNPSDRITFLSSYIKQTVGAAVMSTLYFPFHAFVCRARTWLQYVDGSRSSTSSIHSECHDRSNISYEPREKEKRVPNNTAARDHSFQSNAPDKRTM